jgi:DNA-binding GntR family transcriptional regulator
VRTEWRQNNITAWNTRGNPLESPRINMSFNHTHYGKIAARLRAFIRTGRWQPGQRLPAERALCDQFKLSRITIRQALGLLESERLLKRRHGSGTYVSPYPTRRIPLMIDYTGSMRLHAPELRRRVALQRWRRADPHVAQSLAISAGEKYLYAERIDVLESGQPVAWDQVHISEPFAKTLSMKHLARVDFVETWSKLCRFAIELCQQTIEAVEASAQDTRNLMIPSGKPVLKSTEIYFTQNERRAGFFISYYRPDHICISSTFDWRTRPISGKRKSE